MQEHDTRTPLSDHGLFHSIFRALGKDYINICLIHIADKTIKILKGASGVTDVAALPYTPYEELCRRLILSQAPEESKEPLLEKIHFERVMEILSYKQEYSFTYDAWIGQKKHVCPIKYISLDDGTHVLMGLRLVDDIIASEREHQKSLAKAVAVAEQAYTAAENANRAKTTFLSNMSHDIRTLLRGALFCRRLRQSVGRERARLY